MNYSLRLAALVFATGACAAAQAGSDAAGAPAAASAPAIAASGEAHAREHANADALEQCESAVDHSIHDIRGKQVADLQFGGDARVVPGDGDRLNVKGTGRYRRGGGAPVAFNYSCAFDQASGATSGVVFREADNSPPPALPVWQADLTKISPDACEAAAASAMQSNHPRASGIVFDGNNRKLEPGSEGGTALAGTGRVMRAPGMQPTTFHYRCEFDNAGRLVAARAND